MVKKQKNWIVFMIVLILITLLFIVIVSKNNQVTNAELGVLKYNSSEIQPLNGQWAFIWGDLLTPETIDQIDSTDIHYVEVPSMWNSYDSIPWDNAIDKGLGYGSFYLKITDLIPGESYGLRIRNLGTAGKIYLDDELLIETGRVTSNKETGESDYRIHYQYFVAPSEEVTLLVQISNYEYARGGFWVPIYLGLEKDINKLFEYNMAKDYLNIGLLLAVLIVCITIAFNSENKSGIIYLSSGTVLIILYIGATGDKYLLRLFPNLKSGIIRIQYLVMYLSPLLLSGYIKSILSLERKYFKYFHYLVFMYSLIMTVLVIVLPMYIMTKTTYIGNFGLDIIVAYLIIVLIIEAVFYNIDAVLLVVGFYTLTLGITHDFFYQAAIIQSSVGELTTISYVVFVITMTIFLAKHLKKIVDASARVPMLEQAYYNAQIKPHFLFNVLNSIVTLIGKDSNSAEEMTLNLSTHLRNLLGSENLSQTISIKKELEFLETYIELESIRFKSLEFIISYDETIDFDLPPYTLQPLVENTIKHGFKSSKKEKKVEINIYTDKDYIIVEIIDNGSGIEKTKLNELQKNLMKDILSRHKQSLDSNIGLFNVNRRLNSCLGTFLEIESREGDGTKVFFKFK